MSLIPGARIVRLRISGDATAKTIQAFLSDIDAGTLKAEALVLVEAGDLGPRAAARKTAEDAKNAAAVPCYADDSRTIGALIRSMLKEHGLTIEPGALDTLTARLGNDRGITRQELDKLVLYKGADKDSVTMDDVDACLPADSQSTGDMLADHVGCGETDALDEAYFRALQTGQPPASLLRGITMHFQNLHVWTGAMEQGGSPSDIVKRARPPIHFKRASRVEDQLRRWTRPDVETALTALGEAERQCKSTGLPDELICHRTLLSLTRRAARRSRR